MPRTDPISRADEGRATGPDSIVAFRAVCHEYTPGNRVLTDLELDIAAGDRVAVVGPSGAGKSTLLRAVNGLVTPTMGEVWALGECVSAMSEQARMRIRRRIGMVFQEFALIDRLSVLTNVLVGRLGYVRPWPSALRLFPAPDIEAAVRAIAEVGLTGFEERLVRHLSGGQRQRVGIARALAQNAPLILGDEPTANLDLRTADEILRLLTDLAERRGATLLLNLHDVRAARRYCRRLIALKAGAVVWDGPGESFGDTEIESVFYR